MAVIDPVQSDPGGYKHNATTIYNKVTNVVHTAGDTLQFSLNIADVNSILIHPVIQRFLKVAV